MARRGAGAAARRAHGRRSSRAGSGAGTAVDGASPAWGGGDGDLREPADHRTARRGVWAAARRSRGRRGAGARSRRRQRRSPPVTHTRDSGRHPPRRGARERLGCVTRRRGRLRRETVESVAGAAAARLQVALAETAELRAPGPHAARGVQSLAITAVLAVLLWLLRRLDVCSPAGLSISRSGGSREGGRRRPGGVPAGRRGYRAVRLPLAAAALTLVYLWLANLLRRFPHGRGENRCGRCS